MSKHKKHSTMDFPGSYKTQPVPLEFTYAGSTYRGIALPLSTSCSDGVCFELEVILNSENLGTIHCKGELWRMDDVNNQGLVDAIGKEIFLWYE